MNNGKKFEFEPALKELEAITQWFEQTDVDLDQGLVKFERGMELAAQLKAHLSTVENRVEKIRARFDGAPAAKPAAGQPPESESDPDLPPLDDESSQAGLFGA